VSVSVSVPVPVLCLCLSVCLSCVGRYRGAADALHLVGVGTAH